MDKIANPEIEVRNEESTNERLGAYAEALTKSLNEGKKEGGEE